MKTNNRTIRSLERGRRDKESLERLAADMKQEAKNLSAVLLALNLPSYLELFYDKEQEITPHPLAAEATERFGQVLAEILPCLEAQKTVGGELACSVIAMRDANIRHMHLLSAYADRFTVFEYVLNRLEHRFSGKTLPEGYSDDKEAEEILSRLGSIKDNAARQSTIVQMIEQLPMRMTKKRFFQIVADGLDAYTGSEKQTVEELLFMIRTAALLDEPEGMSSDYAKLYRIAEQLTEADYTGLDASGYETLYQTVKTGMKELNRQMDLVMLLQELLNELAVLVYTSDTPSDQPTFAVCLDMIRKTQTSFAEGQTMDEAEYGGFEQLEGIQEASFSRFQELSSASEECMEAYRREIHRAGLDQEFYVLERLNRLLSSSRFASLAAEQEEEAETADEAYIASAAASLQKELKEQLSSLPRVMGRAVMAKVLTMFPLFIREYQELEEYVKSSLASCSDEAEKVACLEILEEIFGE